MIMRELQVGDVVKTRYPAGMSRNDWVTAKVVYIHPAYGWCCLDCGPFKFCKFMEEI